MRSIVLDAAPQRSSLPSWIGAPTRRPQSVLAALVRAAALLGWTASAAAQTAPATCVPTISTESQGAIFVKVSGITGASLDAQHRGEINASKFGWSGVVVPTSSTGVRGRASVGPVCFTKLLDRASMPLVEATLRSRVLPEVTITFRRNGAQQLEFFRMTLADATVSAYEPEPVNNTVGEKITLRFARATLEQCGLRADGTPDSCSTVSLDAAPGL